VTAIPSGRGDTIRYSDKVGVHMSDGRHTRAPSSDDFLLVHAQLPEGCGPKTYMQMSYQMAGGSDRRRIPQFPQHVHQLAASEEAVCTLCVSGIEMQLHPHLRQSKPADLMRLHFNPTSSKIYMTRSSDGGICIACLRLGGQADRGLQPGP